MITSSQAMLFSPEAGKEAYVQNPSRAESICPATEGTRPTKMFGIGLARTGTTSLHFALELLGFRSAHASTVFSKVLNWEADRGRPLLSTLEHQYDAFLDWPISHLYPELDRRFPNSKFILTVRNVRDRYQSALRHVEEDRSRRARGLSHAWLELESKRRFFQADTEHLAAVLWHFRNRSKDLLVLRITEEAGWAQLCKFLALPVPIEPFPHHYACGSDQTHFLRSFPVTPKPVSVDLTRLKRSVCVSGDHRGWNRSIRG